MESAVPNSVLRAAALLNKQAVSWRRATGGYTPAERHVVRFADGSSVFVKAGTDLYTATQLRAEYERVYARLQAPFLPRFLAWDDTDLPVLVLEDLSGAFWPPPWTPARIDAVRAALDDVHAITLDELPRLEDIEGMQDWGEVARDPAPFLSLGLVTPAWLDRNLPALVAAAKRTPFHGDALVHFDVRSDNICFVEDRAVLIDWNFACLGNPVVDLAGWLPSLESEGGPRPETLLPDAPECAAFLSGYFAAHAGLPHIPAAPNVRKVQLAQLRSALPWVQSALGLPPLDGPNS